MLPKQVTDTTRRSRVNGVPAEDRLAVTLARSPNESAGTRRVWDALRGASGSCGAAPFAEVGVRSTR